MDLVDCKTLLSSNVSYCILNASVWQSTFNAKFPNITMPLDYVCVKNVSISSNSTFLAQYGLFCPQISKSPLVCFPNVTTQKPNELFFPMFGRKLNDCVFEVKEVKSGTSQCVLEDTQFQTVSATGGSFNIYLSLDLVFIALEK